MRRKLKWSKKIFCIGSRSSKVAPLDASRREDTFSKKPRRKTLKNVETMEFYAYMSGWMEFYAWSSMHGMA